MTTGTGTGTSTGTSTGTGDGSGGKVDAVTFLTLHVTRPLVTVLLVVSFCAGFLFLDKITGETFGNVVIAVISFWFASRAQEQRATDRTPPETPGATATAPPSGGTATATVTPNREETR